MAELTDEWMSMVMSVETAVVLKHEQWPFNGQKQYKY